MTEAQSLLATVRAAAGTENAPNPAPPPASPAPSASALPTSGQGLVSVAAQIADARIAERTRIAAILDAPEAKGREDLARHFATKTDMPAEAAIEALKAAPKTEAATGSRLDAIMRDPKVDSGSQASAKPAGDAWADVVAEVNAQAKRHR